jgi:hypothetical protein
LKNQTPTSALPLREGKLSKAVTPFEAYKEALLDLSRLRVFGCATMPNNTKEKHPKKLDPWFKPKYVFIRMQGSKIYKLFNLVTQVVEKYGDADFDEYRFPLR